jgi:threonine dehydratase
MADSVTVQDVLQARKVIRPYLRPTPLLSYPLLDQQVGAQVFVKHENHSSIGSFKARGSLAALSAHTGERRVVACSTGNHGMGVAYAARLLGLEATVVVPEWANREKTSAIAALGGRVVFSGRSIAESQERTRALVREQGAYFADDGGDRLITAGAGTVALEILEEVPDLDVLIIPLGDGALAGGCGVVVKALAPRTRTLGVQAESCPAMFRSWQRGEVVRVEGETLADGLAVVEPHAGAVRLLRKVLDDAMLVSDQELIHAIRALLRYTHNLAEGAGAAALAAAFKARDALAGRKVAVILSGGNLDTRLLPSVLHDGDLPTSGERVGAPRDRAKTRTPDVKARRGRTMAR